MTLTDILREEGKEEGIRKGEAQGVRKVAKNAVKEGVELRLIEKMTGLSRKEIEKNAQEMKE